MPSYHKNMKLLLFARLEGCRRGGGLSFLTALLYYLLQFVKEQSLAGHEDWIRDLHFTQEGVYRIHVLVVSV